MGMRVNKYILLLILIFLVTFAFRLYFVYQVEGFGRNAYFHLREVEGIFEKGSFGYDELSYGGREILYPPLFHYFLAFFNLFLPLSFVLKVIPELLISFLVVIIYKITKEMTKDENAALFAALISGFIPLFIRNTLNQISVYSLVLPIMFYMFYCLMKIVKERKYVWRFVIFSIILPLIHQSAFIFIFTLVFYFILLVSESKRVHSLRREAILFSFFLILLIEFIIFKKAFFLYGLGLIWQNIPAVIKASYFREISIFSLIYNLGIVGIVFGGVGIFFGVFREKRARVMLFTAVCLSILLLLLVQWIDFFTGLMFLGIAFSILSALAISKFFSYLKITKFYKYKNYFYLLILILIILFSVVPAYNVANSNVKESVSSFDLDALNWINKNTKEGITVLAGLEEGYLITAVAKRKNIMDSNFLMAPKPFKRLEDLGNLLSCSDVNISREIVNSYAVYSVYFSDRSREKYGVPCYLENGEFKLVYSNEKVEVYQIV